MHRARRAIAAISSVLVAGAGLGAGLAATVATAPPAGAVITPIVQPNHLVTTTGDGFAFADGSENTAAVLAAVPPAGSTLVGGALIFVSSVAPTDPSGANSAYSFTDGIDTVTLPDAAITSSVINTQTVAVAALPSAFVGNSALPAAGFTGNIAGTGTRRWRFVAVYTTPGATTTKRVAFVVDPTAFAGTSIALDAATPLVPENVTTARVGGITEDNSSGSTDIELREDSGSSTGTVVPLPNGNNVVSGNSAWEANATTVTGRFLYNSGTTNIGLAYALSYVVQNTGSLFVTKSVLGTPAAAATFTVNVDCDGTLVDRDVVFDSAGTITSANSPIAGIPTGTQCGVSELAANSGGASSVVYSVDSGSTSATPPVVTIGTGTTTSVTVINTFLPPPTGSLSVTKSFQGTADAGATFTVGVNCTDDTFDTTLVFNSSGTLTTGTSPITGIPVGTQCTVTETGTGGASSVSYSANGGAGSSSPPTVTIAAGASTVAITNLFLNTLAVTKSVVGTPPSGTTFTVDVNCSIDALDRTLTFDETGTLTSANSPIPSIPTGTQCTVTETGDGGASSVGYSVDGGTASASAPTVTINNAEQSDVAITNTFTATPAPGSLGVTKTVVGTAPSGTIFTVGVNCDDNAFDTTLTFDATGALTSANSPITGIPAGTQCTVTETGTGAATATGYAVDGAGTFSASAPNVTIATGAASAVVVRNSYLGSLDVAKVVSGTAATGTTFTVVVNCTDDAFDRSVTFGATGTLTSANSPITGIPAGVQCTVTETGKGGATTVAYKVGSGSPSATPPTVTIAAGAQTVTVTNTYVASRPALVRTSTTWLLRNSLTTGSPDTTVTYGTKPLTPMFGDWDGNGSKTLGTFEAGVFKLRNTNAAGVPDITFTFGDARGFAVAGDYNGDGTDDVAVFRNGLWQVRLSTGATSNFNFGTGVWPATIPVAGDWDGNGTDGVGVYTYSTATWSLRNVAGTGAADTTFVFGTPSSSYPVVGDWNGNGTDTVGVKTGTGWALRNANSAGGADVGFTYGLAGDLPYGWRP